MRLLGLLVSVCVLLCCVGCSRSTSVSHQPGVVLIDPGHGGFDGGASTEDGIIEKYLNLAIALCLRDMLSICGVPVEMTRETDVGLDEDSTASIRERKVSDMHRRLTMYNDASCVIAIHQNHFSVPKYHGTQLFYSANHPDSMILAQQIRESVVSWIQPQNNRDLKKSTDGIYLLHHAKTPAVLVECGFLSNPEECDKLTMPAYQQQIAFAVLAGYWNFQSQK